MYKLVGSLEDIIIQSNIFKHILHTNYDLKAEIGGKYTLSYVVVSTTYIKLLHTDCYFTT